jgi:plasmid stabilization system protein ParE
MVRIVVSPEAREDLLVANAWWIANRPAAPELLLAEFEDACALLGSAPRAGMAEKQGGYRRLAMQRTRYVIYYAVNEGSDEVVILRVWHMSRGVRPRLP